MLVAVAIYDGAIFYSRWREQRDSELALARQEAEWARRSLALLGDDKLRILNFYATPSVIRPGNRAVLCYGVNAAKKVLLQPAVEEVWPALSRCLYIAPIEDTEYTLTARDAAGHSVSQSLVLKVSP
jgi:hypothetical protein